MDHDLKIIDSASREHEQISQKPGWVEHDPTEIFNKVIECLKEVCDRNGLSKANVKALGITNQRETTTAFDKKTGVPYYNSIVWMDQRTTGVVKKMVEKNNGNVDAYRQDCGLPINTYFSAQKMRWLLENVDELKNPPKDLCLGTIDTWLIAKLTDCKSIVTDSSNACRTMLMDINTLEWSDKMLAEYEMNKEWLPTIIKDSNGDFGVVTSDKIPALNGVPITGVLGDQHAACLGHVLREG